MAIEKRGRTGLPGGRAHYRTKDAYAAQSREYETRASDSKGLLMLWQGTDTPLTAGPSTVTLFTDANSPLLQTSTFSSRVMESFQYLGDTSTFGAGSYMALKDMFRCRISFGISFAIFVGPSDVEMQLTQDFGTLASRITYRHQQTVDITNNQLTFPSVIITVLKGQIFRLRISQTAALAGTIFGGAVTALAPTMLCIEEITG